MAWDSPTDLIQKFAPLLRFAKSETSMPSTVDWYSALVGYQSASTFYPPGQWSWDGMQPQMAEGDYLTALQSENPSVIQAGDLAGAVSYVHILPVAGRSDQVDIQYWLFYPYNNSITFEVDAVLGFDSKGEMPMSQHWADWECVTVRVDDDQNLVAVFFSQHSNGQWCAPDDGLLSLDNKTHPIVYVAQGSHACYPQAGGPYEVGGVDILNARWSVTDYADGKGETLDLSQPNRLLLVANDALSYFPGASQPEALAWLNFPGRWGPPMDIPLGSELIAQAFLALLKAIPWAAPAIPLITILLGPTGVLSSLGAVLAQYFGWAQNGPTSPSTKLIWRSSMEYLPFGKDQEVKTTSIMPTALLTRADGSVVCLAKSAFIPMVSAFLFSNGKWTPIALPSVNADTGIAAVVTGPGNATVMVTLLDGNLQCWSSPDPATDEWSAVANWPTPAAVGGAAICQFDGLYYIAFAGTDGNMHILTTPDWSSFNDEQIPCLMAAGTNSAIAVPIAFETGSGTSPALGVCNGTLVAILPTKPPTKNLPVSLAAYTYDGGATWDGPFILGQTASYKISGAGAATGPDGRLYCSFADAGKRVRYASSADGVSWSEPGIVAGAFTQVQPAIIFTSSALIYVHNGKSSSNLWWNQAPL